MKSNLYKMSQSTENPNTNQYTMAKLWHGCKSNHKVVNFGKWFLCQLSSNTWNFLHGAFLTPKKLGNGKRQKMGRFFLNAMISAFWTFVKKTHPRRRKLHPKSKEEKNVLQISHLFLDTAGWSNIQFIISLSMSSICL